MYKRDWAIRIVFLCASVSYLVQSKENYVQDHKRRVVIRPFKCLCLTVFFNQWTHLNNTGNDCYAIRSPIIPCFSNPASLGMSGWLLRSFLRWLISAPLDFWFWKFIYWRVCENTGIGCATPVTARCDSASCGGEILGSPGDEYEDFGLGCDACNLVHRCQHFGGKSCLVWLFCL